MYKGERYYISTKELGTTPTQEDSLLAANEWWQMKQAEIDGRNARPAPGTPAAQREAIDKFGVGSIVNIETLPDTVADEIRLAFLGPERLKPIEDGMKAVLSSPTVPQEKTVGRLVETWVTSELQRVHAGKVGLARANMNKVCLHHFLDWVGAATPCEAISEAKWLDWYTHLNAQITKRIWDVSHVDRIFGVSKRFVKFLWEMRLVELPRNLDSKRLAFTVPPREIELFTGDELKRLFTITTGQSKLHILLMLNCGFVGKDISDLRPDEVDWKEGIVTRKRSKTHQHEDVPVVRYKLWGQAFDLLEQHRSADPNTVLLTTSGKRWIEEHHDGEYHRSDKVASNFKYWLKRAKVKHAPKALRATVASKLAEHPQYKFYAQYFLGQSPRTVAGKHYVKPADKEFFKALAWLEGALGLKD